MKLNSRKTEYLILSLILIVGFLIRFYNYASFSLSNDELSAIYRCNFSNFHDLFQQGVGIDYHPAGVQTFLYYWIKVFGNSEQSVRLPFVIFGSLAILFTYLFSRRWFGAAPALFAAAAIAFLEFPVIYSQIARPYSSGLMLSMLLAWLWSVVLFPKEKEKKPIWIYAILLGIAFALNLYNHYFSGLLAFIIGVSAIVFLNKNNIKPYLAALLIGSLLFVPHIPMTLHHMSKGGLSSWLGAPSWWWPVSHIETIFTTYFTLIVVLITVLYLRYKSAVSEVNSKIRTLLLIFFLLPLAIGFFYSIWVNPVIQNSVLIFSMPFLIIFVFSFLPKELNKQSLIGLFIVSSAIIYSSFFDRVQRVVDIQDFKGIAQTLIDWDNAFPEENILRIMDSNSPDYIKYYLKDDTVNIKFAQWKIRDEQDLIQLKNILDTTTARHLNYVLLANFNNIAFNMMANKYPFESYYSGNSNTVRYAPNANIFFLHNYPIPNATHLTNSPMFYVAKYSSPEDSVINLQNNEFSQGIEYNISNDVLELAEVSHIEVQTNMNIVCHSPNTTAHLVISLSYDDPKKESIWRSAPLRYFLNPDVPMDFYFLQQLPLTKDKATVKVYIWNPNHEDIDVKNINIFVSHK
jgi:hypothetical protein